MDPEAIHCVWNLRDPGVAKLLRKRFEDYPVLLEIVCAIDAC